MATKVSFARFQNAWLSLSMRRAGARMNIFILRAQRLRRCDSAAGTAWRGHRVLSGAHDTGHAVVAQVSCMMLCSRKRPVDGTRNSQHGLMTRSIIFISLQHGIFFSCKKRVPCLTTLQPPLPQFLHANVCTGRSTGLGWYRVLRGKGRRPSACSHAVVQRECDVAADEDVRREIAVSRDRRG